MSKQFFSFKYEGVVDIPISDFINDPLLVLRNLPKVETITQCDELDYRVVTKPYITHPMLVVVGISHVKLEVVNNELHWVESPHQEEEDDCNGKIVGIAKDNGDGRALVTGTISVHHVWLNMMTWQFMKPIVKKAGDKFIEEFVTNLNNPVFENEIQ